MEEDIILMSCLSVHVTLSLLTCIITSVCVCVDHQTRREVGGGSLPSLIVLDASVTCFDIAQLGSSVFFPPPSRVA